MDSSVTYRFKKLERKGENWKRRGPCLFFFFFFVKILLLRQTRFGHWIKKGYKVSYKVSYSYREICSSNLGIRNVNHMTWHHIGE